MFSGFVEVCDISLYLTEARQEQHRSLGTHRSEFGAFRGRLFSVSFSRNTRGKSEFYFDRTKKLLCLFLHFLRKPGIEGKPPSAEEIFFCEGLLPPTPGPDFHIRADRLPQKPRSRKAAELCAAVTHPAWCRA